MFSIIACSSGKRSTQSHSVSYEVIGNTDGASVTYQNQSGGTEQADVGVPWSKYLVSHDGDSLYVSAQNREDVGSITVRIAVDGKTVKTATSQGGYVIATVSARCCEGR
jgi:hypothetical protein